MRRALLPALAFSLAAAAPGIHPTLGTLARFVEATGTAAAVQQVDLMARVAGVLQSIEAPDGAFVHAGQTLFVIEPPPYESKLRQAQAAEDQQRALLVQAEAELARQQKLRSSSAFAQSSLDNAQASRDSARAAWHQAQEATRQAAITLGYTRVTAPFDGILTAHLVATGTLVGENGPTKLASLVQLDPIWVNATLSEAEVMRLRAAMAARGRTLRDLGPIRVEAQLTGETGFPHQGTLDYAAPMVDGATGTLAIRARFANAGNALLPGYFVRLRIPLPAPVSILLLPPEAVADDQGTPIVTVLAPDGTLHPRPVRLGGLQNGMQVIEGGLDPTDRVLLPSAGADTLAGTPAR